MLNYKSLHSKIEEQETNAIYYLLRKFGLLQETVTLSSINSVTGEYGVYTYNETNRTLIISNAEPTTNYKVVFTILDADNNARTVSVTGKETNGSVNITVPSVTTEELLLEKIGVVITYTREIKPISYPYNLTVTCDKNIIQTNESAIVTATLTQEDVAVSGETLSYTVKHGTTTIDSGTITTDSNGEITISYTGTAAGKIDVVVSYGNLLQETYELYDCIFHDDGVSGTNTKWDCLFVTKSLENNGIKFLVTSTSASARASMNPVDNASVYDFDAQPMVFECYLADFYVPSNAIGMQFIQTGNNPNKQMNFSTQDIGHTIKVVYDGTSLIKYRDDVEVSRISVTYTDKIRVGFTFYSINGYIIVRDVKAYPI